MGVIRNFVLPRQFDARKVTKVLDEIDAGLVASRGYAQPEAGSRYAAELETSIGGAKGAQALEHVERALAGTAEPALSFRYMNERLGSAERRLVAGGTGRMRPETTGSALSRKEEAQRLEELSYTPSFVIHFMRPSVKKDGALIEQAAPLDRGRAFRNAALGAAAIGVPAAVVTAT